MVASTYDDALKRVFEHEGGYSNHPSDPGGPTNWGITIIDARKYWKGNATAADVQAMPVSVAKDIYRTRYADPLHYDELPAGVDYAVLDYGINSGISRSAKVLQKLVGMVADGEIGPETLRAVKLFSAPALVAAICDERLAFLQGLKTWETFGKGWGRRVSEVRAAALKMAAGAPSAKPSPPTPARENWLVALVRALLSLFKRPSPPTDLASRIVAAMRKRGLKVDTGSGEVNIVYVEGMGVDGKPNDDKPNAFNDLRCVIVFEKGIPKIIGKWEGTTEPGRRWTDHPMNPNGAARVAFGQYRAWKVGTHNNSHEALVQTGGPVTVYRDLNKDYERTGDKSDAGYFGINQHHGYDLPIGDLGSSSAGCLVGRTSAGHREFMRLIKCDPRYVADRNFIFSATVLPASEV